MSGQCEECSWLFRDSNANPLVVQPVDSLYTDCPIARLRPSENNQEHYRYSNPFGFFRSEAAVMEDITFTLS
jgi:hypothetical protein